MPPRAFAHAAAGGPATGRSPFRGRGRAAALAAIVAFALAHAVPGASDARAQQGPGTGKPPVGPAAPAAPAAPSAPVVRGPRPTGTDFAVLEDGSIVEGVPAREGPEIVVRRGGAEVLRKPRLGVSVAFAGGEVVHRGEDAGLLRAWRSALGPVPELVMSQPPTPPAPSAPPRPGSKGPAKPPAGAPAQPPAPAPSAPAAPPAPVPDPASVAARAEWWKSVVAAASACGEAKMQYAACALLSDGIEPGLWDEAARDVALSCEPVEFPFSPSDDEKAILLAKWARELAPIGGRFVLRKDGSGEAERSAIWNDAVVVKSRNLILRSLDHDVRIATSVLVQGERTVRGLESFFGVEPGAALPMEVRLFRDREQYLTESDSGSGYAPIWSAGFFSPAEHVSRFYVMRQAKSGTFLEGELHEVLSHELTHHWIEMRYCASAEFDDAGDTGGPGAPERAARSRGEQPGHWIVEGFARFVEDQAVLWGRGPEKFDSARAESVLSAAGAYRAGMLIPMTRYIEISPRDFGFLSDAPKRGTKQAPYVNTERGIFYDQGGALAFFLANRKGADAAASRKALVKYLRDVYGNRMQPESWKALGFASAADLDREFGAFLATVK